MQRNAINLAEARERMVGESQIELEPPRPLRRPMSDPEPYPVQHLGALRAAVEATSSIIEAPVELCAQSALANAALALQAHADVILPTGQSRPLSLFLISVALSGDRKTSADIELGWGLNKHERNLADAAKLARSTYDNDLEAWTVARSAAKTDSKGGRRADIARSLEDVGLQPTAPLDPVISLPDPTLEGLQKYLAVGQPSVGLFNDDGGMFVGGFGMAKENALKTAAGLSKFWDGSAVKRVRSGDGNMFLSGRRVSLHLMIQPSVAVAWLADPVLQGQGFFSRFLVAAPKSIAGTRLGREASASSRAAVNHFGARLLAIFERPNPVDPDRPGELSPRRLSMSRDATDAWWGFRDTVEKELGETGKLYPVQALANKIAEHAARLAAVIAMFGDSDVAELDAEALERGTHLANWYLGEALRLAEGGMISDDVRLAEKLQKWLREAWPHPLISPPDVYQRGPNEIREHSTAMRAIDTLASHGWLHKLPDGGVVNGVRRKLAYSIREADNGRS